MLFSNIKSKLKFATILLALTLLFSGVTVFANDTNLGEKVFANTEFKAGDYLLSQNSRYMAVFQGDGNLVVYRTLDMKPLWATYTNNVGTGTRLCFQGDSNLVIYSNVKEKVQTGIASLPQPIWDWEAKRYVMGNLPASIYTQIVKYGKVIWSSNTVTTSQNSYLIMQNDSNLVIYNSDGKALWANGIKGK